MADVTHKDDSDFIFKDDSDFVWSDVGGGAASAARGGLMLLVDLTINAVLNRISDEAISLTNFWSPEIISFRSPQQTMSTDYGGYCRMNAGDMALSPSLFESDWPPPKSCACVIKYTLTTEAAAVTIYEGTATRRGFDSTEVSYTLKAPDYDETIADAVAFTGNDMETDFNTIITGISEISSVNTTNARVVQPGVEYTTSGEQLRIELASQMAAFYGHMFYIIEPVAYLIDMLLYNGSTTFTEFEFFPPQYWDKEPVASVMEITTENDFTRFSSYPHGRKMSVESYHTTQGNINTALDDIITLENRSRCSVQLPIVNGVPAAGERLQWTDTRLGVSTDVTMYARTFRFDLAKGYVEVEGDATITAT